MKKPIRLIPFPPGGKVIPGDSTVVVVVKVGLETQEETDVTNE